MSTLAASIVPYLFIKILNLFKLLFTADATMALPPLTSDLRIVRGATAAIAFHFLFLAEMQSTTTTSKTSSFRVIGAGLPRTGTASLKVALEMLELGPTFHMYEIFDSAKRGEDWRKAIVALENGEEVDPRPLVEGYRSGLDAPVSDIYVELAGAFPDAKVILTWRPAEEWWHSMTSSVLKGTTRTFGFIIYWLPPFWNQYLLVDVIMVRWERKYGTRGPGVMTGRIAEAKAAIPSDRLLVYRVQEGWEPLCKFLNVPVPDVPFPRVNDNEAMNVFIGNTIKRGLVRWLGLVSGVLGVVSIGFVKYPKFAGVP